MFVAGCLLQLEGRQQHMDPEHTAHQAVQSCQSAVLSESYLLRLAVKVAQQGWWRSVDACQRRSTGDDGRHPRMWMWICCVYHTRARSITVPLHMTDPQRGRMCMSRIDGAATDDGTLSDGGSATAADEGCPPQVRAEDCMDDETCFPCLARSTGADHGFSRLPNHALGGVATFLHFDQLAGADQVSGLPACRRSRAPYPRSRRQHRADSTAVCTRSAWACPSAERSINLPQAEPQSATLLDACTRSPLGAPWHEPTGRHALQHVP